MFSELCLCLGKFWEFKLFWHGVEVGTVTAEIKADQLELEVS